MKSDRENEEEEEEIVPQAKLKVDNVTAGTSSSLKTDWAALKLL